MSHLPASCHESALCLEQQRGVYEEYDVFAPGLIDGVIAMLRKYNDANLREQLKNEEVGMEELVERYYYCG